MLFDPVSAWLVSLITSGIEITSDRFGGRSATQYEQQRIRRGNQLLNADIRRVKRDYGLVAAEAAYEQIQRHINATINVYMPSYASIVIDLDNQEYIIALLEACAKTCNKYEYKGAQLKTEWYKKAAIEARRKKEQYAIELEKEAIEKEKQKAMSAIYCVIGLAIFVAFIAFLFS